MYRTISNSNPCVGRFKHRCGANPVLTTQSGASAIKLATDFGHVEVASWLASASAGWSTLRVCAEARLHWVASSLFSSGQADAQLMDNGTSTTLLRRASSHATGGLTAVPPHCRITARLFTAALSPWRPRNHRLFGPKFRKLAVLILCVHHRLGYTGPEGRCGSPIQSSTPLLPVEMWLAIISHIARRDIDGAESHRSISRAVVQRALAAGVTAG